MVRIALAGLGAALAGIVMDACFQAYLDPGLVVSLTTSLFLCQ